MYHLISFDLTELQIDLAAIYLVFAAGYIRPARLENKEVGRPSMSRRLIDQIVGAAIWPMALWWSSNERFIEVVAPYSTQS